MSKQWLVWLALYVAGTALTVSVYALVISQSGPSSQAAELAVVVDGVDPENGAGLRVDLIIDAPVDVTGCAGEEQVRAIISGTPQFWKANAAALAGNHRVGIGLRTSYDESSARLADWAGYSLPRDLENITGPRVENPSSSKQVKIATGGDRDTGATWYTATIHNWGKHWTPLVLEFKARLTSRRALGSCYLVLPGLLGVDTPAVDDADAAAAGKPSVFDLKPAERTRGAVTFGRVIVHTNGRLLDGEARPKPRFVDGNPWVSDLGDIGEEAAVWTCAAGERRAHWPDIGSENNKSGELALDKGETENPTCDGLAVIEAHDSATLRDLSLLVIGGVFAIVFGQFLKQLAAAIRWLGRKRSPPKTDPTSNPPNWT
jgi:hypothetical protein